MKQLYRVWWKGQLLGEKRDLLLGGRGCYDLHAAVGRDVFDSLVRPPEHAARRGKEEVLFVDLWQNHPEHLEENLMRNGVDVPPSKDQAAAAIEKIITP